MTYTQTHTHTHTHTYIHLHVNTLTPHTEKVIQYYHISLANCS